MKHIICVIAIWIICIVYLVVLVTKLDTDQVKEDAPVDLRLLGIELIDDLVKNLTFSLLLSIYVELRLFSKLLRLLMFASLFNLVNVNDELFAKANSSPLMNLHVDFDQKLS